MKRWLLASAVLALGFLAIAGPVTVAVAPFRDEARTGLVGVGMGLGRMLAQELSAAGYAVVPPDALASWLEGQGMQPSPSAWRGAALALGADYLVLGRIDDFHVSSLALTLVFVTVKGASVELALGATVEDLHGGASRDVHVRSEASGPASLELNLYFPADVCWGGFRTDKSVYYSGEAVELGYLDPSPPRSFHVVIHPADSATPSWTSPILGSTPSDPCVRWTWDQMFGPDRAAPGDYVAELYDDTAPPPVLIAARSFTISPTAAAELVVGSRAFLEAPWGEAVADAVAKLAEKITTLVPKEG